MEYPQQCNQFQNPYLNLRSLANDVGLQIITFVTIDAVQCDYIKSQGYNKYYLEIDYFSRMEQLEN